MNYASAHIWGGNVIIPLTFLAGSDMLVGLALLVDSGQFTGRKINCFHLNVRLVRLQGLISVSIFYSYIII